MRAAFAGYVFELIGCDAMHNADKFARFSTTDATVDCRVEVVLQQEYLRPQGKLFVQTGDWRCDSHGEYKRYYHRNATLMIGATDDFSRVRLTFCTAMPMLETVLYLQVQQMICSFLLLHGASLIHSAGLVIGNEGVLLCGRSGVGKSTMTRQLQQTVAELSVLSEDMPAILRENNHLNVSGTPLCGGDEQCHNGKAPLSQIVFLRQAKDNRLIVPAHSDAMYELLTVLPRATYAREVTTAATDLAVMLVQHIPTVIFENDGTPEAARMLLQHIQKKPREQI